MVIVRFTAPLARAFQEVESFSEFRDRVRTSINVLGDAFAACIVSHYLKGRLDESDKHNEFHAEIREEIGKRRILLNFNGSSELLKSAASSRRPSISQSVALFDYPEESSPLPTIDGRGRCHSLDNVLTWRDEAVLEDIRSKIQLNPVKHI